MRRIKEIRMICKNKSDQLRSLQTLIRLALLQVQNKIRCLNLRLRNTH